MTRLSHAGSPTDLSSLPLKGSPLYLAAVCLVASLGGLLFGFDTAVVSGTFESVEAQYDLNKFQVGWFGSSAVVGCILGALCAGMLSDRFGRKPSLLLASILLFVSALYSCIPQSFDVLIYARIIGGVGVGIASVAAPLYISEFSPPHLRGRLVAFYQLSIVLGILVAYFSNWLLSNFALGNPSAFGGQGRLHQILVSEVWRGMFGAEMIPCVLFFGLLFLVPESPRWLVKARREGPALSILARIAGRETASRELAEIRQALAQEEGSLSELFRADLRPALIVAVGLSVLGQMTGVNIVVYYGPEILKTILAQPGLLKDFLQGIGLADNAGLLFQVLFGLINLVFTLIAIWKVDSWGRRPLLIWGMAVVAAAMGGTGLLVLFGAPPLWTIALLCVYMGCVAVSICGVIWVLTPEIFPNRIRGRAMSIAIFANWATNAASAFLFPWYVDKLGLHTGFFTFALICLFATVFFWRLVPETKGKSLEEIERHWASS